jgi:hypothetical protein
MAVGTATALTLGALALQGGGMGYNAYQQNRQANRLNQRQDQLLEQAAGMRQTGPGAAEQQLLRLLSGDMSGMTFDPTLVDPSALLGQGGFNLGQDALMQMLRATPESNANKSLEAILAGGGMPFDTSELFGALETTDRRNTNQQVAGLRAGASGLGQRFGSATQGAEVALRQGIAADTGTRNAGIQQGSHEAAQNRLLQAIAQLGARDQLQAGLAQSVQQGGLSAADFLLGANAQNNQFGLAGASLNQQNRSGMAGILQQLLSAEQGRNMFNLQTLGLGAGMQPALPSYGYGNAANDLGQLIMFMQLLGRDRN